MKKTTQMMCVVVVLCASGQVASHAATYYYEGTTTSEIRSSIFCQVDGSTFYLLDSWDGTGLADIYAKMSIDDAAMTIDYDTYDASFSGLLSGQGSEVITVGLGQTETWSGSSEVTQIDLTFSPGSNQALTATTGGLFDIDENAEFTGWSVSG